MTAKEGFTWWLGGDPKKFPLAGPKTKKELEGMIGVILKIVPKGIQVTPLAFTAEGTRVAMEAKSHAVTVDGKVYSNDYHFLLEIKDGKVQSVKEYLDTMHTNEIFCR